MKSEAVITQEVLLKAASQGATLYRNNVGACQDKTGRVIRYGVCNESAQINRQFKSSDLLGITPVLITPAHIGHTLGVFTSYEIKREDWAWQGTARELAQNNWLELIIKNGGIGGFLSSADHLKLTR